MSTYRERREARADRLDGWAEKRANKAQAAQEQARALADRIPFGQPILLGHHSQRRAERDRDRIVGGMDRAIEHQRKAESMASRAGNIRAQLAGAIYSDDENAIEALRERIAGLEAERDRIKAYNASCRKGSPDLSLLDDKQRRDISRALAVQHYACKGGAFPAYHLSNLSGNIKRNRDRLALLERSA